MNEIQTIARRIDHARRYERRVILWLRQHGASERRLATALQRYFVDQANRVAASLIEFDSVSRLAIDQAFNSSDELQRLLSLMRRHVLPLMAGGAQMELEAVTPKPARQFDFDEIADDEVLLELPQTVRQAVARNFVEVMSQPFWRDPLKNIRSQIGDAVQRGISRGKPLRQIIADVQELLFDRSRQRAQRIARTETTGALNAGHHAAREGLAADGLLLTKHWLAVGDNRVRDEHGALNDVEVGASEDFNVGGELAPYPGHHSLSAAQRVNCRCVVVAGKTFAD